MEKSPPLGGPTIKSPEIGSYGSYLGGIGVMPPQYPLSPTKPIQPTPGNLGQSFVDYLWNSRSGLPHMGFPYPLSWPKRPLASLPGMSLDNSETKLETTEFKSDIMKSTSTSAFTPVNSFLLSPDESNDMISPIKCNSPSSRIFSEEYETKDMKSKIFQQKDMMSKQEESSELRRIVKLKTEIEDDKVIPNLIEIRRDTFENTLDNINSKSTNSSSHKVDIADELDDGDDYDDKHSNHEARETEEINVTDDSSLLKSPKTVSFFNCLSSNENYYYAEIQLLPCNERFCCFKYT